MRLRLGIRLREIRKQARVTPAQAAGAIRGTPSKISRMELGRVPLKVNDVADLLTLYRMADGPERDALLEQARATAIPHPWGEYQDPLPARDREYLGLEAAAQQIRCYQPHAIPPLLQTRQYADAAARAGVAAWPGGASSRLLTARQEMLTGQGGPHLWAIIDEAALLRPAGGTHVMREQAAHLIRVAKEPNISIQVLRLTAGLTPASAPFILFRFTDPGLPDVVYVETPAAEVHVDRTSDVASYRDLFNKLAVAAEPARATADILQSMY